ncbi:AraC family transcriptional regulator [Echinicola sediminis]
MLNNVQLNLLNAGKARLDKRWDFDNVISPFYRLYLVTEGSGLVHHSGTDYLLKPGYLYLIPSFTYSRYICPDFQIQYYLGVMEEFGEAGSIFDHYHFTFEVKAHEIDIHHFNRIISINPNRELINDDPKAYDNFPTLETFKKKNLQLTPSAFLETQSLLGLLLSRFILKAKITSPKSISENKIHESIKFIRQHLHQDLTVKMVADTVNMSVDYYSSLFKKTFGLRPLKYIQTRKVERAQLLLASTNDSLEEIAAKIGLDYVSYFSRLFKEQTGKTPGEYRKDLWRKQ